MVSHLLHLPRTFFQSNSCEGQYLWRIFSYVYLISDSVFCSFFLQRDV